MFSSLNHLFILTLLSVVLGVSLSQYTFPNLITFSTIQRPSSTFGTLRKVRANSEYLIAMSDNQIIIYSKNNLSIVSTLKPSTGVFSSISSNFIDFTFSSSSNNLIGILFKSQLNLYNILNKTIIQTIKNTLSSSFYRVYLTKSTTAFLLENHYVYRFSRTTMALKDAFDPGYVSMPTGIMCQTVNEFQYYTFWTGFNRVKIYESISSNKAKLVYQTPNDGIFPTNKINRIVSNSKCTHIFIQSDDYRTLEIYQISSKKIQKLPRFKKVFSHFQFDSLNIYSGVILQNIMHIYKINTAELVKTYTFNFNYASTFIDTDKFNNYIYIGLTQFIKILKFQCGQLTYMNYTNLCSPCSQSCFNCSNVDGACYSCINQNYTLINNGSCIENTSNYTQTGDNSSNSSSQNVQYEQFQQQQFQQQQFQQQQFQGYINFTIQENQNQSSFLKKIYEFQKFISSQFVKVLLIASDKLSFIIFFLSASPFGYLFLSFMNFWNITSIYILLDIRIPQYLRAILKMSYDLINSSLLQYLDQDQRISSFFADQYENQLIQKYPQSIQFYNITSKFASANFEPFIFLTSTYFIILVLYICRKNITILDYFLSNNQVNSNNYLLLNLQQFSTIILPFCLNIFIIKQHSYQNVFVQKINLILIIIFYFLSINMPFFQISSFWNKIKNKKDFIKSKKNEKKKLKKQRKLKIKVINHQDKQNDKIIKAQRFQLLYLAFCNIVLPTFVGLSIYVQKISNIWFFFFVFLHYILGIYTSHLKQQNRINSIIMSCYFVGFHLGYLFMWIIDAKIFTLQFQSQQLITRLSGLTCLFFLALGAVHQILFFIYKIFIFCFLLIKQIYYFNRKVKVNPKQKNLNIIQLQQKNKKKICKKKFNVQFLYNKKINLKNQNVGLEIQTVSKKQQNQNIKIQKIKNFVPSKIRFINKQLINKKNDYKGLKIQFNSPIKHKKNLNIINNNDENQNKQTQNKYYLKYLESE